jgi:N-acetylmuramoyl-L-alanine amidase
VVIDPGHGGAKPGAHGGRIQEKELTLSIAKKFGKLIADNYPDVKVIYTRTTDVDISLAERAHIANRNKADLFISIHANSHPTASPTGVETFVMGLSESRANLEVAKKENADILLEADYKKNSAYKDFDPNSPESYVMLAMFQNAYLDKSLNFAQAIQNQYKQNLKTINRGVKQAELFVLYKTTCPSVLTEVGFISNPAEEAFMMSDEGQAKIAISLFNAFMTYKATEEGINKIAKPKYNIPGAPKSESVQEEQKPAEEQPVVVAEEKKPAVEKKPVVEERKPLFVVEETQPEPEVQHSETVKEPEVKQAEPVKEPEVKQSEPVKEPEVKKSEPVKEPEKQAEPVKDEKPVPSTTLPVQVPQPAPTVQATPTPQPSQPTPKGNEPLSDPKNSAKAGDNEFFTVQILSTQRELRADDEDLKGLKNVMVSRNGVLYSYSVGRFSTFAEANDYCNKVQRQTSFKDAWVVRRQIGKVQNVPAAPQAQPAQTPSKPSTAQVAPKVQVPVLAPTSADRKVEKGVTYSVQFSTSRSVFKVGDPDMHGIKDFRYEKSGKVYVYFAGNYKTLAEAKQRCATLQNTTPFKDAFVVGFRNGKRFVVE